MREWQPSSLCQGNLKGEYLEAIDYIASWLDIKVRLNNQEYYNGGGVSYLLFQLQNGI